MGIFRSIVETFVGSVLDSRNNFSLGGLRIASAPNRRKNLTNRPVPGRDHADDADGLFEDCGRAELFLELERLELRDRLRGVHLAPIEKGGGTEPDGHAHLAGHDLGDLPLAVRKSLENAFQKRDSLGPLCRTVQDAVWIDAAMRGLTLPSIARDEIRGLRLVVPETVFLDDAEDSVVSAFENALCRLQDAGAIIRRQAFPIFSELFKLMAAEGPLVTAEAFALHRSRILGPDAEQMDHHVVARTRLGEKTSMASYIDILNARERMIAALATMIHPDEFLVSPTLPHVAPPIAPLVADDDLFVKTNSKTLRNTLIGNFFDWCGVSIPCGTGDAGMPVGLLLSGLPNTDEQLLSIALAVEETVRGLDV